MIFSSFLRLYPKDTLRIPIALAIFQSTGKLYPSHLTCYFIILVYLPFVTSLRARVMSNLQCSSILAHTGGTPRLDELIGHIHWAQARFYQGRGQEHSQVKSTGCAFLKILTLPLTSCVILGKLLSLFLHLFIIKSTILLCIYTHLSAFPLVRMEELLLL